MYAIDLRMRAIFCDITCTWSRSGVARVFFTIASNTASPEASQLQTHRNYGRWSVGEQIVRTWRSGSSRLRPLSGYAQTTRSPLMGRKPKSADLLKRASQQTSSIDKYFEQTSPSVSPGRQLSEANAYVC